MKEKPILLNAEMVRAVLDGRKTQTRRIMREQPEVIPKEDEFGKPGFWIPFNAGKTMVRNEDMYIACPFGLKGDRLWVREAFAAFDADWIYPGRPQDLKDGPWPNVVFPADGVLLPPGTCRPSIHMPRWASRITLEITGVRVERLNSMTESDALAEGCHGGHESIPGYMYSATPHEHFHHVWQSIYGADSWQANPWVWVITFRRIE